MRARPAEIDVERRETGARGELADPATDLTTDPAAVDQNVHDGCPALFEQRIDRVVGQVKPAKRIVGAVVGAAPVGHYFRDAALVLVEPGEQIQRTRHHVEAHGRGTRRRTMATRDLPPSSCNVTP